MGFGVPIGELIRTDLKEWTKEILSESNCKRHDFLYCRDAFSEQGLIQAADFLPLQILSVFSAMSRPRVSWEFF